MNISEIFVECLMHFEKCGCKPVREKNQGINGIEFFSLTELLLQLTRPEVVTSLCNKHMARYDSICGAVATTERNNKIPLPVSRPGAGARIEERLNLQFL